MNARPHVVHAVRSGSFAGVERYICDVAGELHLRGWAVTVVGGDPSTMRQHLPDEVPYLRGQTTWSVAARLLTTTRPSLFHAHMTAAEVAALTAAIPHRIPTVATRHFSGRRGSTTLGRFGAPALARRLAHEIAISDFVRQSAAPNATVVLNGVPATALAAPGDSATVLCMQRLEPEKDTATALRAWALTDARRHGWELIVAGRGSELRSLEGLAQNLGVAESVHFMGFVNDPTALRASAGVFLATAPAEPFGLAVVEAMAAGLPVVAACGGAHLETVDGSGRLFTSGDADACAAALDELCQSRSARVAVGRRGYERYSEHLTLSRHVDRLEEIYAGVLA